MRPRNLGRTTSLFLLVASALGLAPAAGQAADAVADFYRGKQIRVIIGVEAGTSYDLYARAVTRHMVRHIPGNPVVLPQNMFGASGRIAANWMYNVAPRDGSVIATFSQSAPVDQALKQEGVQFDAARFNWLGNPIVDSTVTITWAAKGIRTLDDVRAKGLICGGTAASSPSNTFPQIINNLTGTRIRIISGYNGATASALAMERGEVDCVGNTWAGLKSTLPHLLAEQKLNILVQWGVEKHPEIVAYHDYDVPLSVELAKTDQDRRVMDIVNSGIALGRPLVAPPDVPRDRIEALRRAFDLTMKDPEFIADAAKEKLDLNPLSGEKMQTIAGEVAQSSPEVMSRVKELMTPKDIEKLKP